MTHTLRERHCVAVVLLGVATLTGVVLALAVRPTLPPLALSELPTASAERSVADDAKVAPAREEAVR